MRTPLLFLSSDARILESIRQGDEAALEELFHANRRMILSFVVANSGSADDGEDVLQEALIVLWERVRTGRFEYSAKLSTFIYGVAKNLWMRRRARARREIPTDLTEEETPDAGPSILDRMIGGEEEEAVRQAMHRIGEPCLELLLLFYWEELSTEEIASKMGFANADVVKSKKYQCKKSLEALVRRSLA
jgi:RNA polymerase sigma factor (sigma-70 family)